MKINQHGLKSHGSKWGWAVAQLVQCLADVSPKPDSQDTLNEVCTPEISILRERMEGK